MATTGAIIDLLLARVSNLGTRRGSNIIAFSGGVDSSLSAALVHKVFPQNSSACIGISAALPQDQLILAREVASSIGIHLQEVRTNEGYDADYIANKGKACYHCKTHLYSSLMAVAELAAAKGNIIGTDGKEKVILFNGTNKDDLRDDTRIGLKAAENFKVASPLAEITKDEVRLAAKALGLPNWQHAASPCLRSRLAFGVAATKENLERIDKAEAIVRRHLGLGPEVNLRVRAANPTWAAVAVDQSLLEAVATHFPRIEEKILALGFKNVSFRAYRTGMMSGFAEQQQNTT
mmetsp:Transcript_38101/g.59211  ORF Transcript_38101/g.59211 Transcript_38101/m.59211 type:complete len:292 (-) Transcript_38101:149-1024(-)